MSWSEESLLKEDERNLPLGQRLRLEKDRLMWRLKGGEVSLDNSEKIVIETEKAKSLGVYELARYTIQDGEERVIACPLRINRQKTYQFEYDDNTKEAEIYRDGGRTNWRLDDIPEPKPLQERTSIQGIYESKLINWMYSRYSVIVFVNPSDGALAIAGTRPFFIECAPEWRSSYLELIKDGRDRLKVFCPPANLVRYYGSNAPPDRMDHCMWIALTPNPFATEFPYSNFIITRRDLSIEMTYTKKTWTKDIHFPIMPNWDRLSPLQVDDLIKTRGQYFFMDYEGIDFVVPRVEAREDNILFFPGEMPPYANGISQDENYVWDIEGPGTVSSRRHNVIRYCQDTGRHPVPITRTGEYGFGWLTCVPGFSTLFSTLAPRVFSTIGMLESGLVSALKEDKPHIFCVRPDKSLRYTVASLPMCTYSKVYWDPSKRLVYDVFKKNSLYVRDLSDLYRFQFFIMRLFFFSYNPEPYVFGSFKEMSIKDRSATPGEFVRAALSSVPCHVVSSYDDVRKLPRLSDFAPKGTSLRAELLRFLGSTVHYGILPSYLDDPMSWQGLKSELLDGELTDVYNVDVTEEDCRIVDMTRLGVVEELLPGVSSGEVVSALSRAYYGTYVCESKRQVRVYGALVAIFKQKQLMVRETVSGWTLKIVA